MYEFDKKSIEKLESIENPYPPATKIVDMELDIFHLLAQSDPNFFNEESDWGGRIFFKRVLGKVAFIKIQDATGQLQLFIKHENFNDFDLVKSLDIGDFVCATGTPGHTETGELSLIVSDLKLAAKNIRAFPDRQKGVRDLETRSRQRELDLVMNPDSLAVFKKRSEIIHLVREYMQNNGIMEVETPTLHPIPGGANAKPFLTHHNKLHQDMYLRIAPELYLKRLIVGGFTKVYELGKCFRNEGISQKHNPEFTMLEFYMAWWSYQDLINFTVSLFKFLDEELGLPTEFNGHTIDWNKFTAISMSDIVYETTGKRLTGMELVEVFESEVEHTISNPTFITHYPIEVSPLARPNDDDPTVTDRFELFIAGWEFSNGFSELNDPVLQAKRFQEQADSKHEEAMHFDSAYIDALCLGMPPTAGQGIGIDRLVMLLTGVTNIRDVILFPTMKS